MYVVIYLYPLYITELNFLKLGWSSNVYDNEIYIVQNLGMDQLVNAVCGKGL